MLIAFYVCAWHALGRRRVDVAVVDLVSLPLLVFWVFGIPTLFYCHFPDKLLAQSLAVDKPRRSKVVALYRATIEAADALALRTAAHVACNSRFTASAYASVFPHLPQPSVIYPCVSILPISGDTDGDDDGHDKNKVVETETSRKQQQKEVPDDDKIDAILKEIFPPVQAPSKISTTSSVAPSSTTSLPPFFLSLNRYERKKNHALAIRALSELRRSLHSSNGNRDKDDDNGKPNVHLVIAGGYDLRLPENRAVGIELSALAAEVKVSNHVTLLRNVSDGLRTALLARCTAVLYTPANEHFGIVPLEAMRAARPVVAVRSGGPCETVVHSHTGFLCDATPDAFAGAMLHIVLNPDDASAMGSRGRTLVTDTFSRNALGRELDRVVRAIARK